MTFKFIYSLFRPLFIGSSAVLVSVIILFFVHPLVGLELNLALIALIGAVLHVLVVTVITGKSNPSEILEKVEWGRFIAHRSTSLPRDR